MLSMSILKTAIIILLIIVVVVAIIKRLVKLLIFVLIVIVAMTGYFMFRYNMSLTETVTQYKEDIHYAYVSGRDIKSIAQDADKIAGYSKQSGKSKDIDSCISDTKKCINEIKTTPHSKAFDKYISGITGKLDNLSSIENTISQAYKGKNSEKVNDALKELENIKGMLH